MKTLAEIQVETQAQLNVAKWTVMIYFAVSSDLDNEAMADLKAIKRVGSTDEIKILAQLDSPRYGSAYRFLIQDERTMFEEDIKAELPEINNGDPKELNDFIRWGMREYPARHYLLVLWGHGRGWENLDDAHRPAALSSKRPFYFYIDSDRQAEKLPPPPLPEDVLMLEELSKALKSAVEYGDPDKIDIFGMDACLMGMAEVGYQIRDSVRYLVASEDAIPKDGWPYDRILTRLKERPGMTPEQLSVTIIRELLIHYREKNKDVTLSVCDLGQSGRLASALRGLANALKERLSDFGVRNAILAARVKALSFYMRDYVDLYDFCSHLNKYCTDQVVIEKCQAMMNGIRSETDVENVSRTSQRSHSRKGFVFEFGFFGHSLIGANGISIYFPVAELSPKYANLQFAKDSAWGDFLIELTKPVEEAIKQKTGWIKPNEMEDIKDA
jgi:hypothetical protein